MELLIILAIVVVLAIWVVQMYNNLVNLRNRVRNGFAQIDVQLTRRYDLIPNLIESVKGYMKHERETLEAVINARNTAVAGLKQASADPADPDAIKALAAAETTLGGTLGRLFALAESYPDLKANQNFLDLQARLTEIEEQIQFARRYYNGTARDMNILVQSFPSNIIARSFGFTEVDYFEIELATEREAPRVKF